MNSTEEDIKNAEHFINSIKTDKEYQKENGWHGYYNKEIVELARILEHILSDYKRVLKENEELKADNYELNNRITDLLENIPIQKVKDKIEELNSRIEIYREYVEQEIETDVEWVDNVADRETVKVLQKLIEEREEK